MVAVSDLAVVVGHSCRTAVEEDPGCTHTAGAEALAVHSLHILVVEEEGHRHAVVVGNPVGAGHHSHSEAAAAHRSHCCDIAVLDSKT